MMHLAKRRCPSSLGCKKSGMSDSSTSQELPLPEEHSPACAGTKLGPQSSKLSRWLYFLDRSGAASRIP